MYYGGGGGDTANNRHPSFARHNGKEAIREALQHHVDRLEPNRTKADFSVLGRVFDRHSPAQRAYDARQNKDSVLGAIKRGWNHPTLDKGHGFNPLDVIGQTSHGLAQMFDPRSKQGIANVATIFAGGPKEPMDGPLMAMGHTPLDDSLMGTGPLDRGLVNEGPRSPSGSTKGAGIRGLVRRAQGVGGYRKPPENPFNVLKEMDSRFNRQVNRREWIDENKQIDNQLGASDMKAAFLRKNGMEPYSTFNHDVNGEGLHYKDTQPFDFTDRLKAIRAYDNPEVQQAFGGNPEAFKQALYDMLFGGKGLLRKPGRPGMDNPYGSPYGGGPFG